MAFLENKRIMPGVHAKVKEKLSFNQTITLEVKGQEITLGFASAKYIYVEIV
jgi:Fe2+ transport system protein FeoA